MNEIDSRQILWNIEIFDEIHVLNASVRTWPSKWHDQVLRIE